MLTYTVIKDQEVNVAKLTFFIDQQVNYLKKETLLDSFTSTSKPLFTLDDKVTGSDIIMIDSEHAYDVEHFKSSPIFFVSKSSDTSIFNIQEKEVLRVDN